MSADADARFFGLDQAKTAREVNDRYRELAKTYHPDHAGTPEAGQMFARLQDAVDRRKNELRDRGAQWPQPPKVPRRRPLSGTPASQAMGLEVLLQLTTDLRLRERTPRGATIEASIESARMRLEHARPAARTALAAVNNPNVRWVNTRTLRTSLQKPIVNGRLRGIGLKRVAEPVGGTSVASCTLGRRRVVVLVEQTRAGLDVSLFVSPKSTRVFEKWLQRIFDSLSAVQSTPAPTRQLGLTPALSPRRELSRPPRALPRPKR